MIARMGPLLSLLVTAASVVPTLAPAQKPTGLFRDPEDGQLDLSEWLLTRKGFLPMPILITEPAIGYGGGLAVAFFNQSIAERRTSGGKLAPPTIAVAGGFYTESDSYGGALGAFVPFRQDRFRYLGALGAASLNVKFYGFDPEGPLADDPVDYTLEPLFLFQRLQARINRSDLFVGAHYLYLNATSTFDVERPDEIPPRDLEVNVGGFGTSIEYDTRDNLLDAKSGLDLAGNITWYEKAFGGDESFGKAKVQGLFYGQPLARWGYGLRLDTRVAWGAPPFFEKPYLEMRGLPALQYANDLTVLGEGEIRFSITLRWALLGFIGAGRVAETWSDLDDAPTVAAGGTGFRYLIARALGLGSGVDFAFGPDGDFVFYIQMGAAWR